MITFKEYITEGINKKEFEEALTNSNIKSGCEFEFYVVGFDSYDEDEEEDEEEDQLDSEYLMMSGFPISLDKNNWEVINDASLTSSYGGVEVVTPIMSLPELIIAIEKVFEWMKIQAWTDKSCGFHVHMSLENGHPIDPLKLVLFAEEGLIYKYFEDRVDNLYAMSVKKGHLSTLEPFTVDDVIDLAKKGKVDDGLNKDKYLGIHLVGLKQNHVEFRYMGGADYERKFKEIRELIANYAYWLSIACDPDFKRKEYISKVARLTNQLNYNYISRLIEAYIKRVNDDYMYYVRSDKKKFEIAKKVSDKIIKPYMDKLKSLPNPTFKVILTMDKMIGINKEAMILFAGFKREMEKYK